MFKESKLIYENPSESSDYVTAEAVGDSGTLGDDAERDSTQQEEKAREENIEERRLIMSEAEEALLTPAPVVEYDGNRLGSKARKIDKNRNIIDAEVSGVLGGVSSFPIPGENELSQLQNEIDGYAALLTSLEQPSESESVETDYSSLDISSLDFLSVSGFQTGLNVFEQRSQLFNEFAEQEQSSLSDSIETFSKELAKFEDSKDGITAIYRAVGEDDDTDNIRKKRDEIVEKMKEVKKNIEKKKEELKLDFLAKKLQKSSEVIFSKHKEDTNSKMRELDLKSDEYKKKKFENDRNRQELEDYKKGLEHYKSRVDEESKKVSSSIKRLSRKKKEVTKDVSGDVAIVQTRLDEVNKSLESEGLTENERSVFLDIKADLEKKLEALTGYQETSSSVSGDISKNLSRLKKSKASLDNTNSEIQNALDVTIVEKEKALTDYDIGLDLALTAISDYQLKFKEGYAESEFAIKTMVERSKEVVAQRDEERNGVISSFEEQISSYEDLDIDQPGVGDVFDSVVNGFVFYSTYPFQGFALAMDYVNEKIDGLPPVFRYPAELMSIPLAVTTGLSKGVTGLVEGVGSIVKHPIDTAIGVGTLFGRNPQTGDWSLGMMGDAWSNMGKAIIYTEDFSYTDISDYFEWTGRIGADVLLTVGTMGAGGALKGVKAIAAAGKLGLKGGAKSFAKAVVKESAKQSVLAGKAVVRGVKNLPASVVKTVGDVLGAPGRALRYISRENRIFHLAKDNRKLAKLAEELAAAQKAGKPTEALQKALVKMAEKVEAGKNSIIRILDREAVSLSKNILKKEKQLRKARDAGDASKVAKLEQELEVLTARQNKLNREYSVFLGDDVSGMKAGQAVDDVGNPLDAEAKTTEGAGAKMADDAETQAGAKSVEDTKQAKATKDLKDAEARTVAEESRVAEAYKDQNFWKEGKNEDLFVDEDLIKNGDIFVIHGKEFRVKTTKNLGSDRARITLELKDDPSFNIQIKKAGLGEKNKFVIHEDQWPKIKQYFEDKFSDVSKTQGASKQVVTEIKVVADNIDSVSLLADKGDNIVYLERIKNDSVAVKNVEQTAIAIVDSIDSAALVKAENIANQSDTLRSLPALRSQIDNAIDANVLKSITQKIDSTVPAIKTKPKLRQYLIAASVMLAVGYIVSKE